MAILRKLNAEWALRLSLGAMYLYSGIDIVRHPAAWTWAVRDLPQFLQRIIADEFGINKFLYFQGMLEIAIAAMFLLWFVPKFVVKYVGLLSAIEMALIVLLVGIDAVTFRDIGLIGPGLALFLML